MKALSKCLAGTATVAAAAVLFAAPAAAQSYDYRYDRDRDVVDEVVDGVARVAGAVAQVTRGGYYDPRYGNDRYGYDRGGNRYAADACAYEAQRRYARRYGRVGVDIRDVQWYRANRMRVYGTLDVGGYQQYGRYDRNDRYGRYDQYDRYNRNGGRIAFTCTVRPDGRVTDFDTNRNSRYGW